MIQQGLIFKIYKQLIQLDNKNQTTPPKNGRRPKETFRQRRYTSAQNTHEMMLNITNTRTM